MPSATAGRAPVAALWRLRRGVSDPICFNYQPMVFRTTRGLCASRKLSLIGGRPQQATKLIEPPTFGEVLLKAYVGRRNLLHIGECMV